MYQYKAVLVSSKEVIVEGHSIQEIENGIKTFKRGQKKGKHTSENEKIEIIHVFRNQKEGKTNIKEEIIKIV
ncbi:MAG: MAG6790 family protein [Metamycoplasmataceae bacterium]